MKPATSTVSHDVSSRLTPTSPAQERSDRKSGLGSTRKPATTVSVNISATVGARKPRPTEARTRVDGSGANTRPSRGLSCELRVSVSEPPSTHRRSPRAPAVAVSHDVSTSSPWANSARSVTWCEPNRSAFTSVYAPSPPNVRNSHDDAPHSPRSSPPQRSDTAPTRLSPKSVYQSLRWNEKRSKLLKRSLQVRRCVRCRRPLSERVRSSRASVATRSG